MRGFCSRPLAAGVLLALAVLLACDPALAQAARNPFAVGAEQGGGNAGGFMGWILAQQNQFYLALKAPCLRQRTMVPPPGRWQR